MEQSNEAGTSTTLEQNLKVATQHEEPREPEKSQPAPDKSSGAPQWDPSEEGRTSGANDATEDIIVHPANYMVRKELIDDPMLTNAMLKQYQDTFKELYQFSQKLTNNSREKSNKLCFVESSLRRLQEKDRRISEEIMERVELHNELDTLKRERIRESLAPQAGNCQSREGEEILGVKIPRRS
ncbi:hypothetical protein PVAP13_8KG041900 [Panicum virgatum]|uniref:Uncharacterized protein n=1 Tax=Panicum virgatum TaxID=38727 RepID=A0A8T0PGG4_PANVG|nr:hypothetical protein PVAP13_8KG041900 [Panicum virgatum]